MIEFEGNLINQKFDRDKEKRYRANIFNLEQIIEGLKSDLNIAYDTIHIHEEEIKDLKGEVKATKVRYRNFKAQQIAPKISWKEQPDEDKSGERI